MDSVNSSSCVGSLFFSKKLETSEIVKAWAGGPREVR